jgi:hypothetical protein
MSPYLIGFESSTLIGCESESADPPPSLAPQAGRRKLPSVDGALCPVARAIWRTNRRHRAPA